MIIVSITGPTIKEAFEQVHSASPFADAFEFRLDMIQEPSLSFLLSSTRKPIVATCRPVRCGGKFLGKEEERKEILTAASMLGVQYIDLEVGTDSDFVKDFIRRDESKVILSHHVYTNKRIDVKRLYRAMRKSGADVLKFAYAANDVWQIRYAIEFLERSRKDKQKAVAIAMGEFGTPTRILYKKFGGWATYAASASGNVAAPGQISARELKQLYDSEAVTSTTKIFGVIGNPLIQSKGIYLHNPLFKRAKKNSVYCKFPVRNLGLFMKHVAPMLSGFSVTIPHKQSVMKYLSTIDQTAKAIGAANTVVRRRNGLWGTNTDAPGALDAIERVSSVRNKRILIVGAGGAARAIAFEGIRRGAHVAITNRDERKAKRLAIDFGLEHVRKSLIRIAHFDFLVNATSVGMMPQTNVSPVQKSILKKKIVFDAVYNPPLTKLLRDATSVGATIIEGTEMYINQAALQFELYAGVKPRRSTMHKINSRKI